MGDIVYPPPSEFPPGVDCELCTPELYGPGTWPSILYAIFYDISPCPYFPEPPNAHPFRLHQSVTGCIYTTTETYAGTKYYSHLLLETAELRLNNEDLPHGGLFYGQAAPCSFEFPDNLLHCPVQGGEGGFGFICETPTPLTSLLCSDYSMLPWGHFTPSSIRPYYTTRSEARKVAMDHTLVRLANKSDHSRIHVYIDDEDLPE